MAPEDDMMEQTSMKQGENETLWEFIKRYHRVVLDLGLFNYPQALTGLNERVRIRRLWYNIKSLVVQSYSTAYEQAKRDIEIEEEKAARIKTDQLEGLGKKEKKVPAGSGPIKHKDHHAPGSSARGRVSSYQPYQRPPNISVAGCSLFVHQPEIHGEGLTRCTCIFMIIPR